MSKLSVVTLHTLYNHNHSLDYSLTALNHLLTHSITCSLTQSPAHSLNHLLTYSITCSLTQSPVHLLNHLLTHSITCSLTHLITHSSTNSLTYSPTHSSSHLLTHSCLFTASVESEQLIPYTEEDLALLCPNPQLAANDEFVENFIRVCYKITQCRHQTPLIVV